MEQKAYFKNKTWNNAVTNYSDTNRDIPGALPFAITLSIALIPLTNELNGADFGHQVRGTECKFSHLLHMEDLKVIGINENELKNEM